MLKTIKSQQGMALMTMIGILAVITVLAASIFFFSSNDLFQASASLNQTRAEYLARASIEATSKGFSKIMHKVGIDRTIKADMYLDREVTATMYLHYNDRGEPIINTNSVGSIGKAEVKIFKGKRSVMIDQKAMEVDVICYEAVAEVEDYSFKNQAFVPLVNNTSVKPAKNADVTEGIYLGLMERDASGTKMIPSKVMFTEDVHNKESSNGEKGFYKEIWETNFRGEELRAYVPKKKDMGVLVINNMFNYTSAPDALPSNPTLREILPLETPKFTNKNRELHKFTAKILFVEPKVILNEESEFNILTLDADTVVFENEVHLYAPVYTSASLTNKKTIGNLKLVNQAGGTRYVYFKAPVYAHQGNARVKIIEGGTSYKLNGTVDLLGYAYDMNQEFRELLKGKGTASTGSYDTLSMEKVNLPAPTKESLFDLVWE